MSTGASGEQDRTESQALVKLPREVKGVDKGLGSLQAAAFTELGRPKQ